jgi:Uma2 family endonuclease
MATATPHPATLADLMQVPEKAELIAGRIVYLMPTGRIPNRVAGRIYRSLDDFTIQTRRGEAYTDNMGFTLPAPLPNGRESFSPDASYHVGPFSADGMRFVEAAPTFAVEVRSENDYGPAAERDIAEKRSDYFLAGTLAVWDVDPITKTVSLYLPSDPDQAMTFGLGDTAHAEPAVPGWRLKVDDLFASN